VNLDIAWLTSPLGQNLIAQARSVTATPTDIERLRRAHPDVDVTLIGSAIHQAWLAQRAESRWKTTTDFLLTTDGLAQASRPAVAHFHADWITQHIKPGAHVTDLTCGLGFDALAFARAGHTVTAIERDPEIADLARYNLRNHDVRVIAADALTYEISPDTDVIFIDPARRDVAAAKTSTGNTVRSFDPQSWSPPWSFVQTLAQSHRVLAKLAPGIDDVTISDWDASFISNDGDLLEAMLSSHGTSQRAAVLLSSGDTRIVSGNDVASSQAIGDFLVVPDPALTRARALGWLCEQVVGGLVNEHIGWITTSNAQKIAEMSQEQIKLGAIFRIIESVGFSPKTIKRNVAGHTPGSVTIMTRGVKLDVEALRKQLSSTFTRGGPELVIAIYRDDNGTRALLCRRLP